MTVAKAMQHVTMATLTGQTLNQTIKVDGVEAEGFHEMREPRVFYLDVNAVRMITLSTLGAGEQAALDALPETPTHHAHVLKNSKRANVTTNG